MNEGERQKEREEERDRERHRVRMNVRKKKITTPARCVKCYETTKKKRDQYAKRHIEKAERNKGIQCNCTYDLVDTVG